MLGPTHKLLLMATAMMALATGLHAQQQAKWKCQLSLGGTYNSGNINNIGFRNSGSADRNDSTLAFNANYRLLYSEENHSATNRELGGGIVARVSIRPKAKQRIGESTMLNHTTFWQPSVTDLSDFLVTSITKIENKLNRNLFLDIIFEYEYRSVVPPGRRRYDMFTEIALRLQF